MTIFTADDEPLALEMLTDAVRQAAPEAQVLAFSKPSALLEQAAESGADIAFLDIRMRGMDGIELAKRLKEQCPRINLIFVTGYDEYAGDAMALHASGYIMKPVTVQAVRSEMEDLRHPVAAKASVLLQIKCFGNFAVYDTKGELLHFDRSKAQELLAYLVYRSGSPCTIREIAATLFENEPYDKKQRDYVQKIITSMLHALKAVHAENAIIKDYNSLAVDTAQVDCDYYRFGALDASAVNAYSGEFMAQYSWAEFVVGYLENIYPRH